MNYAPAVGRSSCAQDAALLGRRTSLAVEQQRRIVVDSDLSRSYYALAGAYLDVVVRGRVCDKHFIVDVAASRREARIGDARRAVGALSAS